MDVMWKELSLAARSLRRSPGFLSVAVLTLALGIGANTAIFSVVRAVLLSPLPYAAPERLTRFWSSWSGFPRGSISEPEYFDYLDENRVFDQVAVYRTRDLNLAFAGGEPQRVAVTEATGQFFGLLDVSPLQGRVLSPEDDRPGSPPVVVASHGFWQRSLGLDPQAVGRIVRVEGEEYEVVGIMPPSFAFPGAGTDIWRPTRLDRAKLGNRGNHNYSGLARLREGVSFEQAQSDMSAIAARLQERYPDIYPDGSGWDVTLVPLTEVTVGAARPALFVLLAAVGFVLLIACSNVANLTLVRASAKQREMALRAALGASRARLVSSALAESVVVATGGWLVAMGIAHAALVAVRSVGPDAVPRLNEARIDVGVLMFAAMLAGFTVFVFGLVPALRSSKRGLDLRDGTRLSSGPESHRLRGALAALQIALAVVLLTGAGLLLRSFDKLGRVDPGFTTDQVLTMELSLSEDRYPASEQRARFFRDLMEAIRPLPDVVSVGAITNPPLSGWTNDNSIEVEGVRLDIENDVFDENRAVAGDYFETLGIPLLAGETFTGSESPGSNPVGIVSATLAKKYWGDESPIGRRFRMAEEDPWITVIGVVGDVHHQGFSEPVQPMYYLPHAHNAWRAMTVVIRSAGEPEALARTVRAAAARVDASQPVFNIKVMDQFVTDYMARPRFNLLLLAVFALVAVSLAAVGIYGVLSYSVGQRTREIGIRMALGAAGSEIPRLVLRQGVGFTVAGLVAGLALALLLSQLLSSLLFGITPRDPVTFVAVPVALGCVALLALFLPARRAAKVDPMIALRYE